MVDLPLRTRLAYLCFALALLVALGSYQFVSPVKQALFLGLVGTSLEPLAKSLVLVVLVPVLLVYSLVFSWLRDPATLILAVGGFYAVLYLAIALVLAASGGHPGAWLAWVLYYATETRAVILMPMIWSILNDLTSSTLARKVYPLIFFAIQLGGIAGSFVAVHVRTLGGEVGLLLIQAAALLLVAALAWCACWLARTAPGEQSSLLPGLPRPAAAPATNPGEPPGHKHGFGTGGAAAILYEAVEGLWLLLSRPYAFMIFWVSYATLMPRTILDYTNGVLVKEAMPSRADQVAFWGRMGLMQNSATAVLALLGTRPLIEFLGAGPALLFLPVTLLGCTLAVCIHHTLLVSVYACIAASVMAYGLNSPIKEMLYIRTSREIKYKAKSWSEMYGNELMKLLGAQINLWVNNENQGCLPDCFRNVSTAIIVAVWVSVWLGVAVKAGREHSRLEREDKVID